ncbi:MAG: hypothetical protein K6T88_19735, partial [Bacillus sp. (in: Bacteria)]|nr:hypothetical protein [Bacillus sp. (in: firmicutes)]
VAIFFLIVAGLLFSVKPLCIGQCFQVAVANHSEWIPKGSELILYEVNIITIAANKLNRITVYEADQDIREVIRCNDRLKMSVCLM